MSFWLHESQILENLKRISMFVRIGITISLIVSVVGSWAYFFYFPLKHRMKQDQTDLQKFTEKTNALKKELLMKDYENCHERIKSEYQNCLAQHHSVQDTVDFILSSLRDYKLTCKKFNPIEEKDEHEKHYASFNLCVKGKFKKIVAFLDALQSSGHCISFVTCTLQRDTQRRVKFDAHVRIPSLCTSM